MDWVKCFLVFSVFFFLFVKTKEITRIIWNNHSYTSSKMFECLLLFQLITTRKSQLIRFVMCCFLGWASSFLWLNLWNMSAHNNKSFSLWLDYKWLWVLFGVKSFECTRLMLEPVSHWVPAGSWFSLWEFERKPKDPNTPPIPRQAVGGRAVDRIIFVAVQVWNSFWEHTHTHTRLFGELRVGGGGER